MAKKKKAKDKKLTWKSKFKSRRILKKQKQVVVKLKKYEPEPHRSSYFKEEWAKAQKF